MIGLWLALAAAQQPAEGVELVLGLGAEVTANDPFLVRRGALLTAELRPIPALGIGLSGAYYPDLGQADWTALTRRLVFENEVTPDLSRMMAREQLQVAAYPVRGRSDRGGSALGAFVAVGLTQTADDLAVITDAERGADWVRETHPYVGGGLTAEVNRGWLGLRGRLELLRYREGFADYQSVRNTLWFGVDALVLPLR